MRFSHARVLAATVLSALALGCESTTEPEEQRLVDIALDFCAGDMPQWVAYRNEDADWVRLIPDAEGTVTFSATNRVVFAFARQQGTDATTELIYAHNLELEQVSGRACLEETGAKQVNGSVSGHNGANQVAQVTANFASVFVPQAQTTFTLTELPERPVDVIASRTNLGATEQAVASLIIRRSRSFVSGATMAPLDLSILGGEAFAPVNANVTLTGVVSPSGFLIGNFFSQQETSHMLGYADYVPTGPIGMPMVPADRLAAGDYHDFAVVLVEGAGTRGAERFFRAPGPQTLAIAGEISNPFIATLATSPYRRLRATQDRITAYGGAFRIEYLQQETFAERSVIVTVTRLHNGGTGQWRADVPDLSGVAGWQNSWGLQNGGGEIQWTATVIGGRAALLLGASPEDGEGLPFATRSSSLAATQAFGASRSSTAALPRRSWRGR